MTNQPGSRLKDRTRHSAPPVPPRLNRLAWLLAPLQPGTPGGPRTFRLALVGRQGASVRELLPFTGQAHQRPPGCPAQLDRWPEAAHGEVARRSARHQGLSQDLPNHGCVFGEGGGGHRRGRLPPAPARAPPRLVLTPEPQVPALSWDSGHKRLLGFLLLIEQSEGRVLLNQSSGNIKPRPTEREWGPASSPGVPPSPAQHPPDKGIHSVP